MNECQPTVAFIAVRWVSQRGLPQLPSRDSILPNKHLYGILARSDLGLWTWFLFSLGSDKHHL
jgi:hypothetical protein